MIKKTLKILTYPDPFLRKKAEKVTEFSNINLSKVIDQMVRTMRKANGIGLAATQVGLNMRFFVVETKDGAMTFINPEILFSSKKTSLGEEACLSIPGKTGQVERHTKVTVRSFDEDGNEQIHDAEGLFACVIQHELDHLNGILFIDKLVEV